MDGNFWLRGSRIVACLVFAFLQTACGLVGEEAAVQAIISPTPAPIIFTGFTGIKKVDTVGATKLSVSWDAGSDPKIVYYNVYDTTVALKPKLIKQVRAPGTSAVLTNLKNQGYYLLRVVASDADGHEDGNANDLPGIPYGGSASATVQTSSTAILNFADGSEADSINIYCKTADTPFKQMESLSNVALTSVVLKGLSPGIKYLCRAALVIAGYEDNNSTMTEFTPMGSAAKLLFTANPGSAAAGDNLGVQPIVTIMDPNNNIVTAGPDSVASVTLALSPQSATVGVIRGNPTVTAVAGVATFKGISFQEIGSKLLMATKADTSAQKFGSVSLSVESKPFVITGSTVDATKSKIAISADPPLIEPLTANGTAAYTVTISLADKYGNPISGVKPQFGSSNALDSITQPTKPTDVNGRTTGSLTATAAGTRTLSIISPSGLTATNTAAVYVPGPATKVAFVSQPVNAPSGPAAMNSIKVAVQDSQGNTVTTSAATVTLSIFTNPGNGVLSGTTSIPAVNGVAAFSGLGIDKTGTGYKLVANSAPLSVAYSNSFNMLAGVPAKLKITGPTDLTSGLCTTAFTIQLQDWAGNPSNASANTPVTLSGLGSGGFFSSGSCAGVPIANTLNFASGSNLKTLYFKDSKGEALSVSVTDPSAVMSAGSIDVKVAPSKISLVAPSMVISGQCSSALEMTTMGADNAPGPVFAATSVQMNGLLGSEAQLFAASDCSGSPLDPLAIPLKVGASVTKVYLKDNKAENLILNVLDPNSVLNTESGNQGLSVKPSKITFTGPTVAVSGHCSTVFVVTIKDAANNSVMSVGDTLLSINGLVGTSGNFYANNSCSTPIGSTLTVVNGNSFANIYFSDPTSEVLTVKITDPNVVLADSPAITVTVSPSNFAITGPASVKTSVCTSAFTLTTTDSNSNIASAVTPITANLTGAGTGGDFYSDVGCTVKVASFVFAPGENTKSFYYKSVAPATAPPLTLTATDPGGVVAAGTYSLTVNPAPAWIGGGGKLSWFQKGIPATFPRFDNAVNGVGTGNMNSSLRARFDATRSFIYVVDNYNHKLLKYDYLNHTFVGWQGQYAEQVTGNEKVLISGSTIPSLDASCSALPNNQPTPGWCLGGNSTTTPNFNLGGTPNIYGSSTAGGYLYPWDVVSDGTYLYAANYRGWVSKYSEATGALIGWIGRTLPPPNAPTSQGVGMSNSCAVTSTYAPTPGWCLGGLAMTNEGGGNGYTYTADGGMWAPRSLAYAAPYLYVGSEGQINRYNANTGAWDGWIGLIAGSEQTVPFYVNNIPSGDGTDAPPGTCTNASGGQQTPGWCIGGRWAQAGNPQTGNGAVVFPMAMIADKPNNRLYTLDMTTGGSSPVIQRYLLDTGTYLGPAIINAGMSRPYGFTTDGTNFYIADSTRVTKMDAFFNYLGWVGKLGSGFFTAGAQGCDSVATNQNTPGWCVGPTAVARAAYDEEASFYASSIDYDGNGGLIVGQGVQNLVNGNVTNPVVKKYDADTGVYQGALGMVSTNSGWSVSMEKPQHWGLDDNSFYYPGGILADPVNNLLFVGDASGRIKKIDTNTGGVLGWLGGIVSSPTGGVQGCQGAPSGAGMPSWCLGSYPNFPWGNGQVPISPPVDGIANAITGIASDSVYLYTIDVNLHRIQRWRISDGAYMGWIGGVGGNAPTGGTCPGTNGQFSGGPANTGGWCKGGSPNNSSQFYGTNGHLYSPRSIFASNGYLFVYDANFRINRYDAATGAFKGWIGRFYDASGVVGCTAVAKSVGVGTIWVTSNWCYNGVSYPSGAAWYGSVDAGGGFGLAWYGGISGDGTYLYLGNDYNNRVDKILMSSGAFVSAIGANYFVSNNGWIGEPITPAKLPYQGGYWIGGLYNDGTNLYGGMWSGVWKRRLSDGALIGWRGSVSSGPLSGETGCSGAGGGSVATPGWCTGGTPTYGLSLGRFSGGSPGPSHSFGVTGDNNFIYIADPNTHRVTRLPK